MTFEKFCRPLYGSSDNVTFRSLQTLALVRNPERHAKRYGRIALCAENTHLKYRGVTIIAYENGRWEVDGDYFDQDRMTSWRSMIESC